jgi:xeroderma pigmentosum group C-complementing protein
MAIKVKSKGTVSGTKRSKRSAESIYQDGVPAVFQEMLAENELSSPNGDAEQSRPLKRRRVAAARNSSNTVSRSSDKTVEPSLSKSLLPRPITSAANGISKREPLLPKVKPLDAIHRYRPTDHSDASLASGSEASSNESDTNWEEVELYHDGSSAEDDPVSDLKDLDIVIDKSTTAKPSSQHKRRKGITTQEKKQRFDIHKVHILCLLSHVAIRNRWCNDREVQASLKKLLPAKIIMLLHPNPEHSQSEALRSFENGLNHIKLFWRDRFKMNSYGMMRPYWASITEVENFRLAEYTAEPMTRSLFRTAAIHLEGSPDVGAQLFCCLLRSIGLEARLVASLQCLPFTAVAQSSTPKKQDLKPTVFIDASGKVKDITSPSITEHSEAISDMSLDGFSSQSKRIHRIGRVGPPQGKIDKGKAPKLYTALARPKIRPDYPVFWIEVYNAAKHTWTTVDPLVTFTVNQPLKLEPPQNYDLNALVYAVAFEENGTAKDVTRKYTKSFNAKTVKMRIDNTTEGTVWWDRTLRYFGKRRKRYRDQIEDAALDRRQASEGLPRNVQDFKDHPLYVLERHLKRNEIIFPKEEVGKVRVGPTSSSHTEKVYRRRHVHTVRSADQWYRLGRDVKIGEQPLKHTTSRRATRHNMGSDDGENSEVGQYAFFQTEEYVPPRVIAGRIPKNIYGNLDVFVPSMVPEGAVHISHPDTSKAARILGIDFADAVTGFQFKGRQSTMITQGCVVAEEYAEAVEEVIRGLAHLKEQNETMVKSNEALRLWRRFLAGLRIIEKVQQYADNDELQQIEQELDKNGGYERGDEDSGGGFLQEDSIASLPMTQSREVDEMDFGGGFLQDENHEHTDDDMAGGGFSVYPNDDPSERTTYGSSHSFSNHVGDNEIALASPHREQDADYQATIMKSSSNTRDIVLNSSLLTEAGNILISEAPNPRANRQTQVVLGMAGMSSESEDDSPPTKFTFSPKSVVLPSSSVDQPGAVKNSRTMSIDLVDRAESPRSPDGGSRGSHGTISAMPVTEPPSQDRLTPNRNEPSGDDGSSTESQCSLLSHDPEDDDAVPEWLL